MNTIGMRHAPHTRPSGWHSQNPFMLAGWLTALLFFVSIFQPLYAAAPAGQWWDTNHTYRQALTVTTGASAPLNRYNGYTAMRSLNTSTLIGAGKLLASCDDLRVAWWNGSAWVELDRHIVNCNTAATQVWFKLRADIGDSASDDNYYLYYGNPAAGAGPANKNNVYVYYDDFESYTLGSPPSGWVMIVGNATVENHAGSKALRMHAASNNTRINLRKDISPAERDILVEADCKIDTTVASNGYCGPGARWSGTTSANESGYMGEIRYSTDQSLAQKYVTGTWGGVGTAVNETVTRGTYYRVRLTAVGTAIKMYRDGTLKVNATDSSLSSADMLGIDAFNASTAQYEFLDNYLARRFVEAEPSVAAASEEQLRTFSGTVYSDEGVTSIGTGKTVRMLVNGASVGTNATNASGQYSILAAVSSGDAILAYVDENDGASNDATTVTVSNGTNLSGLNLYVGHVIVRHDNAGALSNALMNTAKGGYSDTEILYSVSAGNLTVSGSGTVLYVPSGHSYTPGANVTTPAMKSLGTFVGGSGSITVNGALTQGGGAFTATSGTTTITGDFTISVGTFTHNSGIVALTGTSARTVNTGSASLNNLTINTNTNAVTITGTVSVSGNLTLTAYYQINTGTLAVSGNVTTTASTSAPSSATILVNGTGAQTLGASGGTGSIPGVIINKPSGTLTLQDTIRVFSGGGWTWTAGTVDAGTSTVQFYASPGGGAPMTVNAGSMSFNNVAVDMTVWDLTITGTLIANGNLALNSYSTISTGTIAVAGNVTTTSATGTLPSSATLLLNGAGAQTVGASGGSGKLPKVTINKSSGTLTLQDTLVVYAGWTWTAGTVDAGTSTVQFYASAGNGVAMTVNAGAMSFNNVTVDMAVWNLTIAGNMTVTGNFTITSVDSVSGGTIVVGGNLITADTTVNGSTNITLNGTGAQTITATVANADLPNGTLTISKTAGTATLASNLILNGAGTNVTVNQGTLDLAGFNFTVPATLTANAAGILRLQGGETVTATTRTLNAGSTVIYNGGSTYAFLAVGNTYSNLTFNNAAGSWTHTAPLTTGQNLTITAGTLISVGQNINVAGNWGNSGTYTSGANTVTLDGTNQTITGNTTFNHLTKSVATARTLTFAATTTTTINGIATLNGASGQLLTLASSSPSTPWNLNVTASATKAISFVSVSWGDASSSHASQKNINPTSSTDGGNNIAWFGFIISGTVYTDEGVTLIGNGAVIRLLINGTSQGTSATAGGTGTYSITTPLSAGDALLVYIDGHAIKGSAVTVSNGANLSGLNIYGDHTITRHDNGSSLSNAHMGTAKGAYVDADIVYSVSGGNLVVTSGWLFTPVGHGFSPGANVTAPGMQNLGTFNGGSGSITVQGQLLQRGGTYTATSGTTSISSTFTVSGGTFIHNSGTVLMTSTGWRIYNIGSAILNNFTIAIPSAAVTLVGTIDVDGDLLITGGDIISGTLTVAGNVTTTHAGVIGGAVIVFDGTGAQTLAASGGTGALPGVDINKASGTLTIQDTINIGGTAGWTHTTGSVNAGSSTVGFTHTAAASNVNASAMAFNNVNIAVGAMTLNVTGVLDVNGNLNLTSAGMINGGTLTVAGNLISSDTAVDGTTAITLDGAGAQSINTGGTGDLPNGTFTINKSSGTATLLANLTLNSVGQDITITQGTLDLAGFNLVLTATGDVLTVDAAGTLRLQGGETITSSTKTLNAGSTVIYNGAGSYGSLVMGNNYHHLIFNGAGNWTHTGVLDANGNLTITAGRLVSGGQNVNVAGNWSNSGTYTSGANTVTLDGSAQIISGSTTFYNLSKSVTSADTLIFQAGQTQALAAGGTLIFTGTAGNLLTLRSNSPGSAWFLNAAAGVAPVANYVDVRDSDASGGQTIYAYYSIDAAPGGTNPNWVFGQQLQLVKQVWDATGTTCLASNPSDGACSGGATAVAIPSGGSVYFFIYVRNPMAVSATDVRFQDLLNDVAFTYQTGSLQRTPNDGTAGQPSAVASAAAIFAAATTTQTDAFDGDTQIDEFAGINAAVSPDNLTVGGNGGVGQNDTLNVPMNKSFAIRFRAVGN